MKWLYHLLVSYSKEFDFLCESGSLLFFHQAPQVEKENGAQGEGRYRDSEEPLLKLNNDNSQLHTNSYGLSNLCTISFLLPRA